MSANLRRESPVFIVERLAPTLGMERAVIELVTALGVHRQIKVIALYGNVPTLQGVEVESLGPTPRRFKWLTVLSRLIRMRGLGRGQPVVVVGAWVSVPWLLLRLGPARRVIVWEHSLISEKVSSARGLRTLDAFARHVYRRAARVVAVSDPLASDMAAWPKPPTLQTIPNIGVTVERGETVSEDPDTYVLVGSLTRTKAQEVAIRAIVSVEKVRLEILGDGPERASLEALTADLGVSDRVRFMGHVPHAEAIEAISRSAGLVHCAVGETFGFVYFEAAACGRTVIAASNRVSEWLIPQYVPGATFRDADGLARLLANPPIFGSDDVARAARSRSDEFSPETVTGRWNELFSLTGGVE